MDSAIAKLLVDKIYDKRKAAALDLEKQIRDCHQQGDQRRINQIIDQLVEMFSNSSNALHVRNGGLIGLAGTAIALGVDIAPYMGIFLEPLLNCFTDSESRIRYFSAECLYNISKVSKGEVLVYFNPIFDALIKLSADSDLPVKNGAELLDRLLKDIVAESASVYIPQYPETEKVRDNADEQQQHSVLVPYPDGSENEDGSPGPKKAFSLAHFIPLLADRIYVISPFTRSYLVSWISVLDSVPELELISHLPMFLDGLLKYLSDPTEDVRIATENLLADFLYKIREVSIVQRRLEEQGSLRRETDSPEAIRPSDFDREKLPEITLNASERVAFIPEIESTTPDEASLRQVDITSEKEYRESTTWMPGQGVRIDYAAIIEILIQQLDAQHDEVQQSTALRWLAEFLNFAHEVMLPFTPRLIPAILPNLAHHAAMIKTAAVRTNRLLLNVIQNLPSPSEGLTKSPRPGSAPAPTSGVQTTAPLRQPTMKDGTLSPEPEVQQPGLQTAEKVQEKSAPKSRLNTSDIARVPSAETIFPSSVPSRPLSPTSLAVTAPPPAPPPATLQSPPEEPDLLDYQATVTALTVQFLSEFEETRVAAIKWLIMLHLKAPKKILTMDDGTFPALLKTLSDTSEEVIKQDLQLLAQISSSSEESNFKVFMMDLLDLFSTDRRLLENRGSLIIRQLCLNLNTERIYKTFAEILEKEEDLEFASLMIQKLNIILITSPELSDFRKRLKNLETRQDGLTLFTTLYRSWCHNAVAVFSLCLLAQAYEHASNLLSIFADLEITVPMLVQIDKLVQLIESPVFTYIRLQLLEPERYPYLFKCLYGILMLLPQSSAFVSLRNRLNAVNSAGFLQIAPKSSTTLTTRSKLGREDIKWQDLLSHFRVVQAKHEKARRQALNPDQTGPTHSENLQGTRQSPTPTKPPLRRRITGEGALPVPNITTQLPVPAKANADTTFVPGRTNVLSPLNPRARTQGFLSAALPTGTNSPGTSSPPSTASASSVTQKPKRQYILGRRT